MIKSDLIYIGHINDCIHSILEYTKDSDEASFINNKMVQDAVIRNFEIIGEATKKISLTTKDKYPEIEWKKIAGMRDKLIHDYIGVDIIAVWGVVREILPLFERQITLIIKTEENK